MRARLVHLVALTGLVAVALGAGLVTPGQLPAADAATATGTPGIACYDTGTSGARVQPVYVTFQGRTNRYATAKPVIERNLAYMDHVFHMSALQGGTGQGRHVRFVHDANCRVSIPNITLPMTVDQYINNVLANGSIPALAAVGLNQPNRTYVAYIDLGRRWVSHAYLQPVTGYTGSRYAMVYNAPKSAGWNSFTTVDERMSNWTVGEAGSYNIATHEIVHALGAVDSSAPNAAPADPGANVSGGHCNDGYDMMCTAGNSACPDQASIYYLDCGDNDYYSTNPRGWLASNPDKNVANSAYLSAAGTSGPLNDFMQVAVGTAAPRTTNWTLTGNNTGASTEYNEQPVVAGHPATRTVWWAWRAPAALPSTGQRVTVNTNNSGGTTPLDTLLAVSRGCYGCGFPTSGLFPSSAGRFAVGSNDNDTVNVTWSKVTFTAYPNTVYYFAVDGKNGAQSSINLRLFEAYQ